MNFFMPNPFMPMPTIPFQSFQTQMADSIWNQANYACPKLSDSLVIRGKSVDSLTKEETDTRIKINGIEYNKKNGERLAQRVLNGLPEQRNYPLCARYVKEAIRDTGLGAYVNGNGEYCKYILRANPNFKETKIAGKNLSKLPAGCIIVYDKFDAGYGKDGHVEITLGDGRACSDVISEEIEQSDKAYVFIPV